MSYPDDFKDKEDEDQRGGASDTGSTGSTGSTGTAGAAGKIDVRIATFAGDSRNEPRTPAEQRRFALIHAASQTDRVRRARDRKKALAALREVGPVSLNQRQRYVAGGGSGGGSVSPYKSHPLSQTAYFSGAEEPKIPGENRALDVNQEDQKQLENRLENRLQHQLSLRHAPRYDSTPKPRPY